MRAREIVTGLGGRWDGGYGMAQCPCHADGGTPALKISDAPARSGGSDLHCFAGCDGRDVKIGRQAAAALAERLTREGRIVRVARTPPGIKDFNDLLLAHAS